MVGLFKRARSVFKLRAHSKKLRRLIVTREAKNLELARRLAAGQGISYEHFERWARETVAQFERSLELDNLRYISEEDPVALPVEGRTLLFFHGVRLELEQGWFGDHWHPVLTGCVKWRDGATTTGMRAPFIDPFPEDSRLLERRNEFLNSIGQNPATICNEEI